MKKFWVRTVGKRELPDQARVVAVYGTIDDAREYAYDYMQKPYGVTLVSIRDAQTMDTLEEYEI